LTSSTDTFKLAAAVLSSFADNDLVGITLASLVPKIPLLNADLLATS
jgi:hypothetical protein